MGGGGGGANRVDRIELWTGGEHSEVAETGLGASGALLIIVLGLSSTGMGVVSCCVGGATDTGVKKGGGFDGLTVGEEEEGVACCWANAMLCTALWAAGVCTEFIPA